MLEHRLRRLFAQRPGILYGFADISYSPYAPVYRCALVFAVPYGEQLTLRTYREADFEQGIQDARSVLESVLREIEALLHETKTPYWIPPAAQTSEKTLLAPFSFKYAAVHAGLGWIGKNDVLITERYGPRVRLSAVLLDAALPCGPAVTKSRCPDACTKCVDACPYHALHNRQWNMDAKRSELIDYPLCNEKRSQFIAKHGRKNACGLCLAACPYGCEPEV
ncbi:MAG: 4Fe-4S double cluster binding domain-containing protein [Hominenteromicrobium sp.]